MRKYFLSLVAMAAMILFSGCNKNEDFYISENGDMVTFNIATPEMGTRAFSDGSTATNLTVAVYQGGQYREALTQNVTINGSAQVSLPLVTGVTYDIVFWAQAEGAPYTFTPSTGIVSVDYTDVTANNENLDAFYANRLAYKVEGPKTETVELTRPFAQLNVATLDYELAKNSGIDITETGIVVEGVYTSFNLKTQDGAIDANSATTITLSRYATPKEQSQVLSGYETYSWLSMNYLLVNDKTNIRAKMTTNNGNVTREWHNIPVQRNYRTNILGNILTTTTDFNVVIDEEFAGEQPETMEEKLRLAAQVGGTVILSEDLTLSSPLVISSQMTLDLNGKTISYETTERKGDQLIENRGYLVIEDSEGNGKISYKYSGTPDNTYGFGNQTIQNLGTLIVKGGTIENTSGLISHASYAINTNAGATLNIEGGEILNDGHAIRQVSFGNDFNTVNISGGHIKGSRALMVQLPSSAPTVAPKTNIEITGGKLTSTEATYNLAVYIYSNGSSAENVSVRIDGNAIFDGNVAINGAAVRTMPKNAVIVREGQFNGGDGIFHYEDDVVYNDRIVLYGGSYKIDPSDYVKIAEGYKVLEIKKDNNYKVVPESIQVNIVNNASDLTNATAGQTLILSEDINMGSTQLAITAENVTIDLNGKTLTTANNWGGISLKNGASIKNGVINHTGNTAAIKAFNIDKIENVIIKTTCSTTDKTVTAIAVQNGCKVESIQNVTIEGVSQGIEIGYQATVDLIDNAKVNMSTNGTAECIGLKINGGMVKLAKNCTFKGSIYGTTIHLKGVFDAGLELQNCTIEGTTASIYAWDEKGISNTSGSLTLTYDAATELNGPFIWDFEEECQSVVTLNKPE